MLERDNPVMSLTAVSRRSFGMRPNPSRTKRRHLGAFAEGGGNGLFSCDFTIHIDSHLDERSAA